MKFPLEFEKYEAIPLSRDPAKILIKWSLKKNLLDMSDFEFYVDRGDAPDQIKGFQHVDIDGTPMKDGPLGTDSTNQYQISGAISALEINQWLDFTPYLRNLDKQYYYRVRCRRISTQDQIVTPIFSWPSNLDLVGLYIVEEHNFLFEDVVGTPCLVHIKRRSGIQCRACFDPIQKKRTASFCTVCYSTNWEGGFYKPIDLYVDMSPDQKNTAIAEWGEVQSNEKDVFMSNYPELRTGDIIRELRENRLWRVVQCRQTEKRRSPMLQFARVTEIKPGDVEYQLDYDRELAIKMLERFDALRSQREF
jgi:hypothetical protein